MLLQRLMEWKKTSTFWGGILLEEDLGMGFTERGLDMGVLVEVVD